MQENPITSQPNPAPDPDEVYKKYIPWLTIFVGVICGLLCLGLNLDATNDSWDGFNRWGSFSSADVWQGAWWGLLTSNFVHHEIWHIAFNMYWLWIFGKKIEFEENRFFYIFLMISAGIIASLYQLGFSPSMGIGFSGIGYALFGFVFVKTRFDERYKGFMTRRTTILFIAWLFLCIGLTLTGLWRVGNAAHVSGMLWGALIGFLACKTKWVLRILVPTVVMGVSMIPLFWAPWNIGWLSVQAYDLHDARKLEEAKVYYEKILEKDSTYSFALDNMKLIYLEELTDSFQQAQQLGEYAKAIEYCEKVLELEPDNEWAKSQLLYLSYFESADTTLWQLYREQQVQSQQEWYDAWISNSPK